MQVKKYIVDSMPEALKRIRSDLGKDAIIINTKKIKSGGFLGLFTKEQIEVIAAVDGNDKINQPEKYSNNKKRETKLENPSQIKVPEIKPDIPHFQTPTQSKSETAALSDQLQDMKALLTRYIVKEGTASISSHRFIERLRNQGIDENLLTEIMNDWLKMDNIEEITETEEIERIKKILTNYLYPFISNGIALHTKLAHFIGPTGVGKTTTIAKIAAEQVLKYKRKVGLITSDTYRIAAIDQLRTYANILNVPLEVVYSPKEMMEAVKKLSDCDLILMDTAGRNYRNEMYVKELKNLIGEIKDSETYLVLSMTSKFEDMTQIVDNFKAVKIDKLIFTKLDETSTYGPLLNFVYQQKLPLSYMTYGQSVPDDITTVESEWLIDTVLGERSYG